MRRLLLAASGLVAAAALAGCSVTSSPSVTVPAHPTYGQMVNVCQNIVGSAGSGSGPAQRREAAEYATCMASAAKLLPTSTTTTHPVRVPPPTIPTVTSTSQPVAHPLTP